LVNSALAAAPQFPAALAFKDRLATIDLPGAAVDYAGNYLALRARHTDHPVSIQLETVGRCNAHCGFCPHDQLERAAEEMSDGLYEKIVRDLSAIPPEIPVNFYLNVVNEPFMDKKIFERIALLNQTIPRATLGLYTNLNVLPPGFFEKFRKVHGVTYFNVSFNAANESEYQKTMQVDFKRTVAHIRKLLDANRSQHFFDGPVILSRIATGDGGDARFEQECANLFAEFDCGREFVPICKRRTNWLGQPLPHRTPIPFLMPCPQWLHISVHCNGIVPHCCMDARGTFALGNAKERPLLEIYNQPNFRNYRETLAGRETVYPCNTCAFL
jgi:Iron-sulfur cluster-binding domain/Radical SAM superfamily